LRVLVTGGAGFIGSHLVDRCVSEGYEVKVLDNFSRSTVSNLEEHLSRDSIELLRGDIRDLKLLRRIMRGVEVVFHEAAQVSVPASLRDPIYTDEVNVRGTLNLLVAASEAGVQRFIFASSSSVYGDPERLPVAEDSPLNPLSPYAASKVAGEAYCRAFHAARGVPIVCLRYFNVFGPRQRLDGYASVIPAFIGCILKGEPMIIYGDGGQTRDFVNVRDVVEANILALMKEEAVGETFNVGSGRSTSIMELSSMLREICGFDIPSPVHAPPREGDVAHSLADIGKAEEILGYRPRTDLRRDLKELFEWYGGLFEKASREDG